MIPSTHRTPPRRNAPHIVVAFCGRSKSGKTTLARAVESVMLADKRLYPHLLSFARPLKAELAQLGVGREHPLFRPLAQRIGDLRREIQQEHYVFALLDTVERHAIQTVFLIDDLRFVNEAQVADIIVRLHTARPNALTEIEQAHPSETSWQRVESSLDLNTDYPESIEPDARRIAERIYAFAHATAEEEE